MGKIEKYLIHPNLREIFILEHFPQSVVWNTWATESILSNPKIDVINQIKKLEFVEHSIKIQRT